MSTHKYIVVLEPSEVTQLKKIVSCGVAKARTITRARVLLMTNEAHGTGKLDREICESLGISLFITTQVRKHYVLEGLKRALYEAPRPGKPKCFTVADEAQVVAIACTDAPHGYERWTLNLLQEQMTTRLGKSIGRNTIDKILLRNNCKPWLKKNVVHPGNYRRIQTENDGCTGSI